MSAITAIAGISKAEVFASLAEGLTTAATVVTPNRRLALALKRDFDAAQAARGLAAWESADIVPISAFAERAYEDALYSDHATELPVLLTPLQELALWESVIRSSEAGGALLAVSETGALAREAWQLAHGWHLLPRLQNIPLNEDGRAFAEWAQRYESITRRNRYTDSARVTDVIVSLLGRAAIRKPKVLVGYGFDIITPQQGALLTCIEAAGCKVTFAGPQSRKPSARRAVCTDASDEIRRAAVWARSCLEAKRDARVGVVVPELARHRNAIERIFSSVMAPDYALPGARQRVVPFNVSLGAALSSYPLVRAAFLALELAGRGMEFERASRLLRSPFVAGGETEMTQRGRLDADLRIHAEPIITLERLLTLMTRGAAPRCPVLAQRLSALAEFRKASLFGAQAPSAWAKELTAALGIVGFPGERSLDSVEYQTLKKWHELVAGFAALDRVVPRIGYAETVSRLRRIASDTLFQPETPEVPVQILGVLEAAGMEFDHLWVTGLSDEAWPPSPRPNPFLPVELQRAAKLPQGSAAESLELARRLTNGWLSCAGEVIVSHARRENDRELNPSPLISGIPAGAIDLPDYANYRDVIHRSRRIERIEDCKAPAWDSAVVVSGGTEAIRDHAACPFRALARHRLGAEGLKTPHTGLNAMERGTLVHSVLAQLWSQLKSKSALDAIGAGDLDALLARAAEEAITRIRRDRPSTLSGRFAEIEKRRLIRLARAWLDHEKTRGSFNVIATEDKRRVKIGGLAFNARLDRVDELDDGRRIVIDYKTGAASVGAWLGARPEEPQLPLYLVTAEPDAAALAFARVRAGGMTYAALARDGDLLPNAHMLPDGKLKRAELSWDKQLAAWRAELVRLAASFVHGDARVDPKQVPQTCRYCNVHPFCRIHERLALVLPVDGGATEGDES